MTARLVRSGITLATLLAATAGCATLRPTHEGESHAPSRSISHYLTSREIKDSGAQNAWEALRRLGGVRLQESADGTPVGIRPTRGNQSIVLDDTPIVMLDGARLLDFAILRSVPARNIDSIEFLNGLTGTLKHGTGAGAGAIVILTRVDVDNTN